MFFNRVPAPEGEILSFAPPRQLLLRCPTSCIHAVEKKVSKEKAARLPLMSCAPRIGRGTAKGASCPFAAVRHPCRTPLCPMGIRASPDQYCGARRGKRDNNYVTA